MQDDSSDDDDNSMDNVVRRIHENMERDKAEGTKALAEIEAEEKRKFEENRRSVAEIRRLAEIRRNELNRRAQKGAEDPPNNETPIATTIAGRKSDSTVPQGMSNEESNVPREKGKVLSLVVRLLPLCGEAVGSKPAGKLFNQNLKILTPNPPLPTSRGRQGRVLSEILTKGHIRR